jgi:hypothetical protein
MRRRNRLELENIADKRQDRICWPADEIGPKNCAVSKNCAKRKNQGLDIPKS